MNTIHLNIGLNVAGVETLSAPVIEDAIQCCLGGAVISECYVRQSASERTACVVLRWDYNTMTLKNAIMDLCRLLSQEAIAGRVFGNHPYDFLIGPKAQAWGGKFNEDYWLVPCRDNAPVAADDAVAALVALVNYGSRGGWTIGFADDALRGWFERDSDGSGGGLLFSLENPETGDEDGFLHLIDYDGTYALPRPVLVALRLAGVSVDSSFE